MKVSSQKIGKVIRSRFPKITVVLKNGVPKYKIDSRKGGIGKQEYRDTERAAELRATEIADDFQNDGLEGVKMDSTLRVYATQAAEMLKPFGKNVLQAAEFFTEHLRKKITRENSPLISDLAAKWSDAKQGEKRLSVSHKTTSRIALRSSSLPISGISEFWNWRVPTSLQP